MRRVDLPFDSWTLYDPSWLLPEEADAALDALLRREDWAHRPIVVFGREVDQPRETTWAGEEAYRYSGQTLAPRPFDPLLRELTDRAAAACKTPFNHVVLNLYRDGRDHIGMHADNEPELGRCPVIASLSLGAERRFVLCPKHDRRRKAQRRFTLEHGSLFVMGGAFQHRWRHALPKQGSVVLPRVNLTFRWIRGPVGWREPPDLASARRDVVGRDGTTPQASGG